MRVYRGTFRVEWAHCDAAGIVFYPHFYMWFDQATERLFTANGLSYNQLKMGFGSPGMPLIETGTKYLNASKLGDELSMETWVDEWNGKTFLVKHKLTHSDGRIALEGFERRIWVNKAPDSPKGMKAVEVPADVMARFKD